MAARVLPSTAVMLRTQVTTVPSEALVASLGVSAVAVATTLLFHAYLRVSFFQHQRRQQQASSATPAGGLTGVKGAGGGEKGLQVGTAGNLAAASGCSSTHAEAQKLKAE